MNRIYLLAATCAAALSLATPTLAQSYIQGGGETAGAADYEKEFALYNSTVAAGAATFHNADGDNPNDILYWPSGAGVGQTAFLTNNLSADCFQVLRTGCGGGTAAPGGSNTVHYGSSAAPLIGGRTPPCSPQDVICSWSTSTSGAQAAGHLIQLPMMGMGIAIPVVNSLVTQNGATSAHKPVSGGIVLNYNDLCGIFSGKIYNWDQTSVASALGYGTINVVYRRDPSGETFLLLKYLSAVCTYANANFPQPIMPSTTFLNVFSGGVPPIPLGQTETNFVGVYGASGVANTLSNLQQPLGYPLTSAIGYLSPDFTTVDPDSDAVLSNGKRSALVVAALYNGSPALPYIPLVADLANALNHELKGTTLKAPADAAAGALPQNWVPQIQTTKLGYPIVGFTTFDFAQCYADPLIAQGVINFLTTHYSANSPEAPIIARNGFTGIYYSRSHSSIAGNFELVAAGAILSNTKGWNDNIQNSSVCAGLSGR